MPRVLFTHSYFLRLDPKEFKAMMPYAPLGTLYAAAYVKHHGYGVELFDAMLADSEYGIREHLARFQPDVVVIYDDDFNYLTKMCLERMRHAAFTMSRIAREAGCRVIAHGSDAADHAGEYHKHGADAVIIGEGEQTLLETLNAMTAQGDPGIDRIAGLSLLNGPDTIRTEKRNPTKTPDALPFPARELLDVQAYRALWKRRHGLFSMNIVTTRGCPFHCNWCAKPIYGQVYNSRSPQHVVEEMAQLRALYKPDHLWFCDDIFGLRPGWVSAFADEVLRRGLKIPYKCLSRADLLLSDDAVRHLARSGCETVWMGAESGSQKILDAMEKGTTVEQIRESSRKLHDAGIRIGFFLQYGYPGETRGDIGLTLDLLRECMPEEIGISVSYPLPGTKFYDTVRATLGQQHNWKDSQDLAMMFRGTFHPDFYRTLHKVTHKRFRLWQGIDFCKHALSNPSSITVSRLRRIASAGYHALTLPAIESRLAALERLHQETAAEHTSSAGAAH